VIEVYAITKAPGPRAPGLHTIENGGLAAVCSSASEQEISADELWRRQEVLDALMRDCDLLPVRYGSTLDDDGAAERLLEERRDELTEALDRVRGAVELAVRVAGDGDGHGGAGDGAVYMRVKTRLLEMHKALSDLARESRELAPGRSAYLVSRADIVAFVARVAALEEANEDLSFLCTGPWPPYSFVTP
jgi:hypothetical protein